ncbi:hypothetical protein KDW99_08835 [Marinomonas rhizomae]|uniref:hypothetical protein n=1 Tax=Marinomonas rhizomae TaxID=491948 RepID=UPI002106DD0B|nr:hypothetical protein [Marinomonas rhizomae]UTW01213.1 hypothetical protein KDW99_08835 [Marinomonas rhizomae]
MHKVMLKVVTASLLVVGLVGCGTVYIDSSPMIKTTDQLYLQNVSLTLTESVKPDIEYYSQEEMQKIFQDSLIERLKEDNLYTLDSSQNSLSVEITYHRQFGGDATPFPSDSLRDPSFGYKIIVKEDGKVLTEESKGGLNYLGNMMMKLQIASFALRDKSDEDAFIEGIAIMIAEDIEDLEKQ